MRFYFRRSIVIIFLICIAIATWNYLENDISSPFTQTCNQLESVQKDLHVLTNSVHGILHFLNITNFLCYGTLWGQIRLARILPWEDKTLLCILNEDISRKDELFIVRAFKHRGLTINYYGTEGFYEVYNPDQYPVYNKDLKVILPVFELNPVINMYRRVGWKKRLLPPCCETFTSLDCFPPNLIRPPLPQKEFGGNLLPVPREGIEIQKYHYRDNWWKEVTIKNC